MDNRWFNELGDQQLFASATRAYSAIPTALRSEILQDPKASGNCVVNGAGSYLELSDFNYENTLGTLSTRVRRVGVRSNLRSDFSNPEAIRDFDIQISNTGNAGDWITVVNDATVPDDGVFHYFDFAEVEATHVRLYNDDNDWLVVQRIELWGRVVANGAHDAFVHPVGVSTVAELAEIRQRIDDQVQPQYGAYLDLSSDSEAVLSYSPNAIPDLLLNYYGIDSIGAVQMREGDNEAAYKHALMWVATGNSAHAEKVMEIADDWSTTLNSVSGGNGPLTTAWFSAAMIRSLAIVQSTYSGWDPAVGTRFEAMMEDLLIPQMEIFRASEANGNWQASQTEALLQYAVFTENRYQFNRMLARIKRQLTLDTRNTGEVGETCRDINHAGFGIGGFVQIAEILRVQNVDALPVMDLYAYEDERLKSVVEYLSKIHNDGGAPGQLQPFPSNFSNRSEWDPTVGVKEQVGGVVLPEVDEVNVFGAEMAYAHYVYRLGESMPQTQRKIDFTRANGLSDGMTFHWGLGTLTHAEMTVNGSANTLVEQFPLSASASINTSWTARTYDGVVGTGRHLAWVPEVSSGGWIEWQFSDAMRLSELSLSSGNVLINPIDILVHQNGAWTLVVDDYSYAGDPGNFVDFVFASPLNEVTAVRVVTTGKWTSIAEARFFAAAEAFQIMPTVLDASVNVSWMPRTIDSVLGTGRHLAWVPEVSGGGWAMWQFSNPITLTEILISSGNTWASTIGIEVQIDGMWQTLVTDEPYVGDPGAVDVFTFSAPSSSVTAVRITTPGKWTSIAEIEFYGWEN